MRFIHTADLHIGDSWKILPQDYLRRQELMLDNIYRVAYKEGIKTIAIAGDLFHRKDPTRECRDMILTKILKYDKYFRTIIMEGNHDSVDATASNIHFLKILYDKKRFKNTIIVELENKVVPVEDGAFLVMPIFNENKLIKMASEVRSKYKWLVAMIHSTTVGVRSDTNWVAQTGWDMQQVQGINYYAFGHIHKFQRLGIPNAFQSGSPIQHKWSDQLPKGILVVDTDKPKTPKFVSLAKVVKPLYTVKENDEIPSYGYVRLITNKNTLGRDLPSNVVGTERDLSDIKIVEYAGELDPIAGLNEHLASDGLTIEEQKIGIGIVEKIVRDINQNF